MTAREAALTALERCRRDGAWSGSSIDGIIKKYALDRREAALADVQAVIVDAQLGGAALGGQLHPAGCD